MRQVNTPLSIVIPTLNEADNLQLLFKRVDKALTAASIPYEIIIVDDSSTDATAAIAQAANPKYNVTLLTKQGQLGKAFSLIEGFEAANYHFVCMIDADLQYPPEAIPAMYKKLQNSPADIIITKRFDNKTSALRRLSSGVYNLLFVRLLFGINYDTQSGLKLFKKRVLADISLSPSPWSFDLEFIVRSLEQGYTIAEHQIPFDERHAGVPKVKMLSATTELIRASVRLRRQTASKRVRFNYNRNLQILQRGSGWLIALLATTFIASLLHIGMANAAKVTTPTNDLGSGIGRTVKKVEQHLKSTPVTSPVTSPTTTPTPATPTPVATTAPTPVASTPTSTSSTTSTPVTSSSSSTPKPTNSTASNNPTTLSTNQAKNAAYYQNNQLSQSSTQKFLKLAEYLVEIGGIFIGLGILVVLGRKLTKGQSRAIRSYSQ